MIFKPKEITLPVSWGKLRAQTWGNPKAARTIIALHGWLDNSNSYVPLLTTATKKKSVLMDDYWVCVDMAGHGKSDWRPRGIIYHFFDYIQDLQDVAQALKLKEFHLVGHSLGAGVAAFFAGSFPERVQTLTCLDSLGPLPFSAEELPAHYREFRKEWEIFQAGRKKARIIKTVSRAVAARLMAGSLEPASAELLVTRNLKRTRSGWKWATDPRLKLPTAYRITEEQVRAFLKALQCPVQIIEGTSGLVANNQSKAERLSCFKDLKLDTVEGGHHVHMDFPERVLEKLVTKL